MAQRVYLDIDSAMERTSPTGQRMWRFFEPLPGAEPYPAMSRTHCADNILSTATMMALKETWLQEGRIMPYTITTGGGYESLQVGEDGEPLRLRFPAVGTYAIRIGGNHSARAPIEGNPGARPETAEFQSFYDARRNNRLPHDPPSLPNRYTQYRYNPSGVLWRLSHRLPDDPDECRKLPVTVEISHLAEAYHRPSIMEPLFGEFRDSYKIEYTELEKDYVNLSRQQCARFGLMWRKPDGELILPEEIDEYVGPTMCWHGGFGSPCYGPYPAADEHEPVAVTGVTPSKRKIGTGSGGQGGRAWVARGRKSSGAAGSSAAAQL